MEHTIFEELVERVKSGEDPKTLVELEVGGPERSDDINTPADAVSAFKHFVDEYAVSVPYIDRMWVDRIATQLRSGASASELADLMYKNRQSLAGKAKIPGSGDLDFDTADVIYRALKASYTDQVPQA